VTWAPEAFGASEVGWFSEVATGVQPQRLFFPRKAGRLRKMLMMIKMLQLQLAELLQEQKRVLDGCRVCWYVGISEDTELEIGDWRGSLWERRTTTGHPRQQPRAFPSSLTLSFQSFFYFIYFPKLLIGTKLMVQLQIS
jgi:hypothetical protein